MAVQTLLLRRLLADEGHHVVLLPTNLRFPRVISLVDKVRGVRTAFRSAIFCYRVWRASRMVDLFHVMTNSFLSFFLVTVPTVLIARCRRVPAVVNYRGGLASDFLAGYHHVVRPVLRLTQAVIVPNGYLRNIFSRFGIETQEVPNIVTFRPQKAATRTRPNGEIRLLVLRQLEELYNIPCAIRAFKQIKQRWPQAVLRIAGSGSMREVLENLIQTEELRDVVFLGPLTSEEVQSELAGAAVVLNPTNADNMPISVLEALAAGVPVVSTKVGGVPYLIADKVTGLLVEPDADAQMADQVDRLLADEALYRSISEAGRRRVEEYYWENVKPRLLEVYRSVLPTRVNGREMAPAV